MSASHEFWRLIPEDHLHFILLALGKNEKEHLQVARDLLQERVVSFIFAQGGSS